MTAPTKKRPARDWVDEVAVERALRRERVGRPLSHAERVIAARHIAAHGGGTSAICTRLRVNPAYAAALLVEATAHARKDITVDQLIPELQAILPAAQQLVAAVHGMDPAKVDKILAETDVVALCVVLAAGHRADVDMVQAIAWSTNPDEYQRLRTQGVSPEHAALLAAGQAVKAA
jgi:hypothetical protein